MGCRDPESFVYKVRLTLHGFMHYADHLFARRANCFSFLLLAGVHRVLTFACLPSSDHRPESMSRHGRPNRSCRNMVEDIYYCAIRAEAQDQCALGGYFV